MKSKLTYLFFKLLNRSGNMKSASSSSSSGCEKVTPITGVISVSAYSSSEEADNKSKINSRMSCASDDSCAINELLEGRMDLKVTMPDMKDIIINIERRTPMMDLLVHLATQYRFNAANYKILVCEHEFKANTPIGSLDVNQIAIVPKQTKNMTLIRQTSSIQTPFQTFRLQVNLPRNQLMVIRVTPKDNIAAIKTIICNEKNLDPNKYQLVKIVGTQAPQILDTEKTLAFYGGLNEVTLLSNKSLSQLEMQYGSASTSSQIEFNHDKFLTSTPTSSSNYKVQNFSHSTPDISNITEDKEKSKPIKKRPAPKPPSSTPSIVNNETIHLADSHENIITVTNQTNKLQIEIHDKNDKSKIYQSKTYEEKLIKNAISEPIIIKSNEQNVQVMKSSNANHVRQNSGSDSSGYHESVLSSDSPESSSAGGPAQASSSSTNTTLTNNKHHSNKTNTGTNNGKKRRAPPPPSQHEISIKSQQENDDKHKNMKNVTDVKVDKITSIDCMSDVSIPISTSSASSSGAASASSINNTSLSPIVITQNRSLKSNNNNETRSLPSMGSIQSTMTPSPVTSTSEHSELENEQPQLLQSQLQLQPQQQLIEKVELIEKETETINTSFTKKSSNEMEQQQVSFMM